MAWKLYQLGRWCFRHRGRVVAGWLALLVLGGVGAATLSGQTNDTFELPSTESSQAFDLIKERTPQAATDGAIARVVVQAPEGEQVTSPANQEVVTTALEELTTGHVASVADPFTTGTVSPDGRTAYAVVSYDRPAVELTAADEDAMHDAVATLEDAGLTVAVGGDAFAEQATAAGAAEGIGILVALVVLVITFGSLVAAGLPLLTAIIGVGIGILGVTILTGFLELSTTTPALATDARPRRRHRLRAVRDVPLPPRGLRRARARGGRRPRHRHRRLGRGLRRPHRRHRPRRAVHHRHHLPDPDGPGGRRHRRRRGRRSRSPCCRPCSAYARPARHQRHAARG